MIVELYTKDIYDTESKLIERLFKNYSKSNISVKLTRLYDILDCFNKDEVLRIAKEILVDPIVEEYLIRDVDGYLKGYDGMVELFLRDSLTDVVGESVSDIIKRVLDRDFKVRTGRCFYFSASKDLFLDFVKEEFFNEHLHKINIKKLQ